MALLPGEREIIRVSLPRGHFVYGGLAVPQPQQYRSFIFVTPSWSLPEPTESVVEVTEAGG